MKIYPVFFCFILSLAAVTAAGQNYTIDQVTKIAEEIEARYKAIRDVTCPDDE